MDVGGESSRMFKRGSRRGWAALAIAVLTLAAACDDKSASNGGPASAGNHTFQGEVQGEPGDDTGDDAGPGGNKPGPVCCEPETDEDCTACYRNLEKCCNAELTFKSPESFGSVVQNCQGNPSCRDCCNECASLSCAKVQSGHLCPAPAGTLPVTW